jgi:pimeloyl-ACP methyl ester carboxylesterase
MNIELLINDLDRIIESFSDRYENIVLVGHSMGAAVISHISYHSNVKAIILLDSVEDLAIQSIQKRWNTGNDNDKKNGNNENHPLINEEIMMGWFRGMTMAFLHQKCTKLLILSKREYLESKELLIAEMQGKFQVEIIANSGHAIQEDQPIKLGEIIKTFIKRNFQFNST